METKTCTRCHRDVDYIYLLQAVWENGAVHETARLCGVCFGYLGKFLREMSEA